MQNIFRFLLKHNFIFTFIILQTISIWLAVSSNDYQRFEANSYVSAVEGSIYEMTSGISGYFKLNKQNRELSEENAMLRNQIPTSYRDNEAEISLSDSSALRINFPVLNFVPASVIYNSVNQRNNYFIINKGKIDGVKENMGVISLTSIVGVIINVTDHYSSVLPVIHSKAKISVKLQHANEFGIIKWDGVNYRKAILEEIPVHAQIAVNDTIVTSGRSEWYPANIPVGIVKSFTINEGSGFYTIEIEFIDDYYKTTLVYVVENKYQQEIDSLMHNIHE
ncbi:MAG: rod shape-determining protein MreC [Bacteroidales bacterium]|jgi:rod shape-determining protein MreC|nr:rod shape-determining protein MreC [Bacteroidales bacterium]MDD2204033.1 rod shape-determining protein MreC [Bacteroidales bacterium]MDD3151613.1 rod shape-determining protein MreC [Bacteroidales bacterium]MDD3913379.1 rod shape-determining protein MreC [Bacteroidales bacterium]MDD4633174.1 rod shape-determining protein MreC [Bacteroidales bacterium]